MNTVESQVARILPVTVAVLGICLVGCSSRPEQRETRTPATAQSPQTQPQRYDLRGKVVSIDKSAKKLTVDHENIPGFMGAMTMPYPVKDERLLENLTPGDQVTANVVSSGVEFWLENIAVVKPSMPAR